MYYMLHPKLDVFDVFLIKIRVKWLKNQKRVIIKWDNCIIDLLR